MVRACAGLLSAALLGAACNAPVTPGSEAGLPDVAAAPRDAAEPADATAAPPEDLVATVDLAAPGDLARPPGGGRFAFAIAPGMHALHYQYAQLEPAVDALGAAAFTLRLSGDDISRYRVEKAPSPRVEIVPTQAAAARIQADPGYGFALHSAYFDVGLDGARRYVAIGWERIGAAAIDAPVVHAETVNGTFVLRVGAYLGAWVGRGAPPNAMVPVDTQPLRDYFAARGALETVVALGK